MAFVVLTRTERESLVQLFFGLKTLGEKYPLAREEAMTAIRCLKGIHSNAIEDKHVDRIFLQVLLHNAGIPDKSLVSPKYQKAAQELRGQDNMLKWLESQAAERTDLSISLLMEMHRIVFKESWPDEAGRFRQGEVHISRMSHLPPHFSKVPELLHQHLGTINQHLHAIGPITPKIFFDVLRVSAQAHYLVAHVHPFSDGNGRLARGLGDYVMLFHGFYYDVIMTDYRDSYLDALEECTLTDSTPLFHFLEYSYLETLQRISGFFRLVEQKTGG